jgi:hypothetical protein
MERNGHRLAIIGAFFLPFKNSDGQLSSLAGFFLKSVGQKYVEICRKFIVEGQDILL